MIALYTLSSSLHKETYCDASQEPFIKEIENSLGSQFLYRGEDFSAYGTGCRDIIYVRTGGTEGLFRELGLTGDIRLLTSGKSNSLAASMEILSYIRSRGGRGEIIHGSPALIAERIVSELAGDAESELIGALPPVDLGGVHLGVIGAPSDWLISSNVDYGKVADRMNALMIDIPMDELLYELDSFKGDLRSFEGSEAIYYALRALIDRYGLSGLTLRCFDLLDSVHNTGCLALARLNAEGIPSSCEGDIPALLSMMVSYRKTGCPGFQCNLSRVDGDELLFAHCTVPLSMVRSYSYASHFESGIGTAIKGELPEGPVTIFKISPDLEHYVALPGELVRNQSEPCLCRTQVIVKANGAGRYLLTAPLANHHIIVPGLPEQLNL